MMHSQETSHFYWCEVVDQELRHAYRELIYNSVLMSIKHQGRPIVVVHCDNHRQLKFINII